MNTIKYIFSPRGNVLANIFETDTGWGFDHIPTKTTHEGFDTYEDARGAFVEYHEIWFENETA